MNCFIVSNTDIYYNLALEEFLLKESSKDFFFLWRSEPVVVVGKHQNPYKEINLAYAQEKGIKIARRLSGGGTVFQDLGNINFTLIKNTEEGKQINFKKHSMLIFEALKALRLNVEYSERNDLIIEKRKFSGNAEHVFKNRVLHHGTILFDTDLLCLNAVLKNQYSKYQDKTIPSVKSTVVNLESYLSGIDILSFQRKILNKVLENKGFVEIEPPFNNHVEHLFLEKYKTEEWIFGYTPRYIFKNNFRFDGVLCSLKMEVLKGKITQFEITGLDSEIEQIIKRQVLGEKHLWGNIKMKLSNLPIQYKELYKRFF